MTKREIEQRMRLQLACDLNCAPEDFSRPENVITLSAALPGRRRYAEEPFFFQMASFGENAVLSADERLHPWLREWTRGKQGYWLFEQHNFYALECELRKYGYKMELTHHMFLPTPELIPCETSLSLRRLEQTDIGAWYGRPELSNALCARFHPERPDVLALAAFDGEALMGMAGCSEDAPGLWQIGIDVLPPYRRRGVGTTLVTLLRNEALRRGALPFYGTSLSNLGSWRVALGSGFYPAWVEAEARREEDKR